MSLNYKHILLAVDFSKDSELVGQRAVDLADRYGAKLSLIHVVADLKGPFYEHIMSSLSEDVEDEIIDLAKQQLHALAEKLNIPVTNCLVELGSPKFGIVKAVEENDIDLIVIGTHGVSGWDVLLGSTADTVLHKAPCDVFAIRLSN
jgi:universal stress protein A